MRERKTYYEGNLWLLKTPEKPDKPNLSVPAAPPQPPPSWILSSLFGAHHTLQSTTSI